MVLTHLRIASLNCSGINDRYKRIFIFNYLKKSNIPIIFLQETKIQFKDENRIKADWHNQKIFINCTNKNQACEGCMILINNDHIIIEKSILTSDGRCIVLDINFDGCKYHIINTYFPIEGKEKKPFITSLYPLVSSNFPIIWGGDFNLVLDPIKDRYPPHSQNDSYSNDLSQLVQTFNVKDVCREIYPNKSFFTFSRGGSKSRIDRIYVSPNVTVENYEQSTISVTDHEMIKIDIIFQSNSTKGRGLWRNKTKLYGELDFREKFEAFWEPWSNQRVSGFSHSWWLKTKSKIKKFLLDFEDIKKNDDEIEIRSLKIQMERKKYLTFVHQGSEHFEKQYYECKKQLAKKQIDQIKENIINEKAINLLHGDMPTKNSLKS